MDTYIGLTNKNVYTDYVVIKMIYCTLAQIGCLQMFKALYSQVYTFWGTSCKERDQALCLACGISAIDNLTNNCVEIYFSRKLIFYKNPMFSP